MFSIIPKIEKEYILNNIKLHQRSDNRNFNNYRDICIKQLHENGQIQVTIGNTMVISQIFSSIISPSADRSNEGVIVFSIESSNFKHTGECNGSNEDISEMRNRINNLLEKSLKDTK